MKLTTFELPHELLVYTVKDTASALANWFKEQRKASDDDFDILTISGKKVGEVDAAGLQLLAAFDRECNESSQLWTLIDPSEKLTQACADLNFKFDLTRSTSTDAESLEAQP
jgi:ABC-type transporter Mla MlaB component